MVSEKVRSILHAKAAPFTVAQLATMSDRDGWDWIYTNFPPKTHRASSGKPKVCFTGFTDPEKLQLTELAKPFFDVHTGVVKGLAFLVTGESPGPSKLQKAGQMGTKVIPVSAFRQLIENAQRGLGEPPT